MTASALNKKQELALLALMNQATIAQAAVTAGVSEATMYRYMRDPSFAARYRELRRAAVEQAIGRLQGVTWAATSVLITALGDKNAPPTLRLSAAAKVIDIVLRAVEIDDLARRLEALEAAQANAPALDAPQGEDDDADED